MRKKTTEWNETLDRIKEREGGISNYQEAIGCLQDGMNLLAIQVERFEDEYGLPSEEKRENYMLTMATLLYSLEQGYFDVAKKKGDWEKIVEDCRRNREGQKGDG